MQSTKFISLFLNILMRIKSLNLVVSIVVHGVKLLGSADPDFQSTELGYRENQHLPAQGRRLRRRAKSVVRSVDTFPLIAGFPSDIFGLTYGIRQLSQSI